MKIAILGVGEVGRTYAAALLAAGGHELRFCDAAPGAATRDFVARQGAVLHAAPGPWLAEAELVLSCVVGGAALEVLRAALPHLRPGSEYADLTTADPGDMRLAAAEAEARGILFSDIAIVGGIALTGARTPLLCAGEACRRALSVLRQAGAPVRVLEGAAAGDAVSLKLLRSLFTKGLEALAVECLRAAERCGVRDELMEVLSDIDETPLRDLLGAMVRTHVIHAQRRLQEVDTAARQLSRLEVPLLVQPGVRALFEATVAALAERHLPVTAPDVEQALQWLLAQSDGRPALAAGE